MISNVIKGLHLNVFNALKSLYDYENVFHTNYNSFIFLSDVHVLVMIMEMIAKLGFFMFLGTVNETKHQTFGITIH